MEYGIEKIESTGYLFCIALNPIRPSKIGLEETGG
jgi:hypothetical protein